MPKFVCRFTILSAFTFIAGTAYATPPTIQEIIEKLQSSNVAPNEKLDLDMKIQEPDGSTKLRKLVIKRKSGNGQSAIVRLLEPANLKGVGLLTLIGKDKKQNQYLYLPSEKRSRRIVGSNKKGRFLDSELSFEDMNIGTYENFNNKLKDGKLDGKKVIIIESVAKNLEESSYSKMTTWLDADSYLIIKSEHYDEDGKLLKTVSYDNYKKYSNKVSRPGKITVLNVQKKRGTILQLKKLSLKKLDDTEFSMSALEEG